MALYIYPGNSPVKYVVYDDALTLLTVLFDGPLGLGAFNVHFKQFGLEDKNVPEDSAEHVRYHDSIEREISSKFPGAACSNTVNENHGHFPMSDDADARAAIGFKLGMVKMVDKTTQKSLVQQFSA